jgi:hypothetical protein
MLITWLPSGLFIIASCLAILSMLTFFLVYMLNCVYVARNLILHLDCSRIYQNTLVVVNQGLGFYVLSGSSNRKSGVQNVVSHVHIK